MSLNVESILYDLGIDVLRESGDELIAKCPLHLQRTGREDGNPSWSINSVTYVHHCFSCGYGGTLNSLYRDVAGDVPEDLEWELSKQSVLSTINRPKKEAYTAPTVSEWTLSQYSDVPDVLLSRRHLHRSSVDYFEVRWDRTRRVWVIPIRSPDGELMGFQYRQRGTVLNDPPGMEKSRTLFGLNLFRDYNTITVVESPLDAVRFWNIKVPCVATFGAGVSEFQTRLLARHFSTTIIALDNDAPGRSASQRLSNALHRRGSAVFFFDYDSVKVKDPGDIDDDKSLQAAWRSATLLLARNRVGS